MTYETQTTFTDTLPAPSMRGEPVIKISNLNKSFGNQKVLNNISLNLFKEENLVVLGKSGVGKSVLIKCIVNLLRPDSGTINVLGENINRADRKTLAKLRKQIGFLFQGGALYDSMTVKQNLEFSLKRNKKHITEEELNEKINKSLENVGLTGTLDKFPSHLSGGMRKRVSLARTIAVDPLIMLYDEPTTGLDPVTSDEISYLINNIKTKYKTSSIIITHDIECVRNTANRIIMLHDGNVYHEGQLEEFEQSTDPFIKAFFK